MTRHTRPKPLRDSSRMGGTQMTPGGRIEGGSRRTSRTAMLVCPVCKLPTRVGTKLKEIKGEMVRVRVCKREGCGQEVDVMATATYSPRLRTCYSSCDRSCRKNSS